MKRIEFIAPVEALRGNMSGKQTLVYALNNNPAYEAPAGLQYARNYKPRYIGYRRAKDGAVYFSVKRKSATKVDAASKITMAALGTIQDLKSTFKDDTIQITVGGISGTYWSWITRSYNTGITDGEINPNTTLDKWIDGLLIDMLRYRQDSITLYLRINPNVPTKLSFQIANPYSGHEDAALPISQRNFIKFNPVLYAAGSPAIVYINGMAVVTGDQMPSWDDLKSEINPNNPNYTAQLAPLTVIVDQDKVLWNGEPLYDASGVLQLPSALLVAGMKYTTLAPQA